MSLWCIGRYEIFPFNSTLRCEPLPGLKVAPCAASHRLNSLLFTNQPQLGFQAALQIKYKQFCLYFQQTTAREAHIYVVQSYGFSKTNSHRAAVLDFQQLSP